jgi:hypothetical protein
MIHLAGSIARPTGIVTTVPRLDSLDAHCTDALTDLSNKNVLVAGCDLHTVEEPRDCYWRVALNDGTLNNRHVACIRWFITE